MQSKHLLLPLVLSLFAGCSLPANPEGAAPVGSTESVTTAATDEPFVIDVRSQEEWDTGHVKQATNIPHTEIADRISEVTSKKDAKIIVYCKVGGRAGKAKAVLEEIGFTNVENAGGFGDIKDQYESSE